MCDVRKAISDESSIPDSLGRRRPQAEAGLASPWRNTHGRNGMSHPCRPLSLHANFLDIKARAMGS